MRLPGTVILCCTSLAYPGELRSAADLSRERGNSVQIPLNFDRSSGSGDRMNRALMAAQNQEDPPVCGWIGVEVQQMTRPFANSLGMTELYGAIFDQPKPNSPAAQANIEAGDVVTAINGSPLGSWRDFIKRHRNGGGHLQDPGGKAANGSLPYRVVRFPARGATSLPRRHRRLHGAPGASKKPRLNVAPTVALGLRGSINVFGDFCG
jgi:hypothetical protein